MVTRTIAIALIALATVAWARETDLSAKDDTPALRHGRRLQAPPPKAPGAPGAAGGPGGPGGPPKPPGPPPGGPAVYEGPRFDFIVGGFPKCGTTTLLKTFFAHEETDMSPTEQCSIASPGQADPVVHKKLDETLMTLSTDPEKKRSFKCPNTMYNYKSIVRMEKHSPDAKFMVGVRHPVLMLQSYYNYRVTEINTRDDLAGETIPTLHEVVEGGEPWKGVSIQCTQFEMFLMQLGKTNVTPEQMMSLVGQPYELAIKPTSFKVFLYTVDQLEDAHEERAPKLLRTMEDFLGLKTPLQPFGHENKNHLTGDSGFKETINICDDEFKDIRDVLIENGKQTAIWLRDHFMLSEDVVVANPEHFVETLEGWGSDPCLAIE